jgi:predicted DNA repair protein MutK
MAGFSLLALLDDISAVLDDVAVMAKVAARKTAGVLGDDLALTAQQVFGVKAKRELPVIMSVAKGSLINKLFLIPGALLLSVFWPWLISPLLMIGGSYLCAEGAEKVFHRLFHKKPSLNPSSASSSSDSSISESLTASTWLNQTIPAESVAVASRPPISEPISPEMADQQLAELEKKKISGAIKTDFVLSTEIIVIALGSIPLGVSLGVRALLLVAVGVLMTGVVYGFVALIVKLDDIGFWLVNKYPNHKLIRKWGNSLVLAAPILMKVLTLIGTLAMFMVGGGIIAHGFPFLAHVGDNWPIWKPLVDTGWGLVIGAIIHPIFLGLGFLFAKIKGTPKP